MMTKKKKRLIMILIPSIILVIAGIVCLILYLTTDFMKSDQQLFYKYMMQHVEMIEPISDVKNEKEYYDWLRQNKVDANSEVSFEYISNVNTSSQNKDNIINNVRVSLHEQLDSANFSDYKNIKLYQGEEKLVEAEYNNQDNLYGIRYTDIMKQFVSIENANLKQLAKTYGLSDILIEKVPDQIEKVDISSIYTFTDEEKLALQNTYANIIFNNIPVSNYGRQKNALITYQGKDAMTNAYSVQLTQEQLNNIYIEILEQLKQDEIILGKLDKINQILNYYRYLDIEENANQESLRNIFIDDIEEQIVEIKNNNIGSNQIKFTVYETKGQMIRTTIDTETERTVADLIKSEGNIVYEITKDIADEKTNIETLKIVKTDTADENNLSIVFTKERDTEFSTVEILKNRKTVDNKIQTNLTMLLNDGIDSLTAKLVREDKLVSAFEEKHMLDATNNIVLNDLQADKLKEVVQLVKTKSDEFLESRTKTLKESLDANPVKVFGFGEKNEIVIENTDNVSALERNKFNAKFEFYSGEEIGIENIRKLLEEVRGNLDSVEVISGNVIQLNIEKGKENDELTNKILEIIEKDERRTYKVEIKYDPESKIVSNIILTINE